MAPHSWQDAGSGEIGSPGRIFEMEAAAQRIAEALKADLRSSEIVIDLHRHDLERQRALVWALKDLARQLRHTGYRMEEMFELTDVLAAEIGLPVRPQKKEEP